MAGNGERVRPRWALGLTIERLLIAADDPDLWLEAEIYARRLYADVLARQALAPDAHEDGAPGPNDTG